MMIGCEHRAALGLWSLCETCQERFADPKFEELKRALWAAQDACDSAGDDLARRVVAEFAARNAERAIIEHLREQRPKGER